MAKEEKLRSEIEEKYKWDLSSLYENEDQYNKDFEELNKLVDEICNYKGKITKDANTLLKFLKLDTKIEVILTNMYVYASCMKDQDVVHEVNSKRYNEILNYYSYLNEKMSFVTPELLKTDYEVIKEYIKSNKELEEYAFDLEQTYRYQPYTKNENEEKLLGYICDLQSKYQNNSEVILNSVIDYGYIKDEDGKEVKLTNGNYSKFIKSKDRNVRKNAFERRCNILKNYVNALAINYEGYIKADSMIAKTKGYDSNIDMYLFPDGVTKEVYDNLLKVADENTHVLHKYFKMIKDVLKYDKLCVYDLSAPLTENANRKYTPEEAGKVIKEALSVLGDEYVNILDDAFTSRWIDFYPNKGKLSGYYQTDALKSHPFILANYNDDYNSVSGIAHELGHAVNSYYSNKFNTAHQAKYSLLTAEVASLTNEMILSNYIVNNSSSKEEKLLAINNILKVFSDNFFGTLKEGSIFEKIVHQKINDGETLTTKEFNDIFEKIVNKFYGNDVHEKENLKYSWARISHFYIPFYYYKYSVGACAACFVAKKILSGNKEYLEKYLNYLKLGGSMMPLDALKTIEIDFNDSKVIEEAISYFNELIDKYIEIYNS